MLNKKFEFLYHLIDGEKLLSVVLGVEFFQYRLVFLKYNKAFEILSKVVLHN